MDKSKRPLACSIHCVFLITLLFAADLGVAAGKTPKPSGGSKKAAPDSSLSAPVFFDTEDAFKDYFCNNTNKKYTYPTRQYAVDESGEKTFSVFYDTSEVDEVDIKETQRDSKISQDISTLLQKILGVSAAAEISAANCNGHIMGSKKVVVQYLRSTMTLTAKGTNAKAAAAAGSTAPAPAVVNPAAAAPSATGTTPAPAAPAPAAPAPAQAAGADTTIGTATVLLGPPEHLSLSVDLPVSNRKSLKYDSANGGSLQPTDSSPQFYIAFNYQYGDVLTPPEGWFKADRLQLKFMLQASSKPLNSMGVALGYTLPSIDFGSILQGDGLSDFSFFVGRFWTKQDAIVNGTPQTDYSYGKSWRVGISYNFSDALGKVKF